MKRLILIVATGITLGSCDSSRDIALQILPMESPAGPSSAEPWLFTDDSGRPGLSWIEKDSVGSRLLVSSLDNAGKWSAPSLIASGTNWFVNWADYPVVAATRDGWMAHYLQKSGEGTFAYDVKATFSAEGEVWSPGATLHDDGLQAEHGFVSMAFWRGSFYVAWLDGRKTVMEGAQADHHEGHHGEMTLRAARMDLSGRKLEEWELDNRVCDCCQTAMSISTSGPVVAYRDRSDSEIRDISVVRWTDSGWSKPSPVFNDNWNIAGCPVNGPRLEASGDTVLIAWFSAAEGKATVRAAFSFDGGATFGEPVQVDEGNPLGRVDVALAPAGYAFVSWMEGPEIRVVRVEANGKKKDSQLVANSTDARASGFPQMACSNGSLVFAWTDSEVKAVRVARAKL